MSDSAKTVAALTERISTRADHAIPDSARSRLTNLGHLGDAAAWLAGAHNAWPPRSIETAAEVGVTKWQTERVHALILKAGTTAEASVLSGIAAAESLADDGRGVILTHDSAGSTTTSAAVIGLLSNVDAAAVTSPGLDSAAWMTSAAAVRDAMREARPHVGDPLALLACLDDSELSLVTGLLLGAAARRTPVLLDSVPSLAAALLAHRIAYRSVSWWSCSHRPAHPAADHAIDRLDLHPFVDLHIAESGIGPYVAWQGMRLAISLAGEKPD